MRAGQEKSAALEERLGVVKRKIDAWDQREGEWQARVSRRLRILWAVMGTVVILMAIAVLVDQLRPPSSWMDMSEINTGDMRMQGMGNSSGQNSTVGQEVCPLSPSTGPEGVHDDKGENSAPGLENDPDLSLHQSTDALFRKRVEDPLQRVVDEL